MKRLTFVKFECENRNLDDVYFVGKSLAKIMSDTKEWGPASIFHEIHVTIDDLGCFLVRFALFQKPKKVSRKEIRAVAPKAFDEATKNMRSGIYGSIRINVPKQLLERGTTEVQIGGWSRNRLLVYRPDQIRLQVTLRNCSNCSACIKRSEGLKEFLATEANVKHWWEYNDGVEWLVLKRQPGERPLTILRNVLKTEVKAMSYGREL